VSIASEIKRGHKHLHRALDRPTFVWNGGTYPCTVSSATRGKDIMPGGFGLDADLTLEVELSYFGEMANRPKPKQTITHAGQTWRIDRVSVLPGEPLLKLMCNDPAQRE
jgi:hypothetical protein